MSGFADRVTGAARENSTLSDFIGSIDQHIVAAENHFARVSKIADQVGGPVPRDAAKDVPDAPPEPALTLRLQRKLARLSQLQVAIEGELIRLENSI